MDRLNDLIIFTIENQLYTDFNTVLTLKNRL